MSTLKVNNITDLGNDAVVTDGVIPTYPGQILQVVQSVKTDAFAGVPSDIWIDVTGLSASITPTSTSSKILVMVDLKGAGRENYTVIRSRLLRDSSPIYVGDAASNRPQSMAQFYGGQSAGYVYMAQLGGTFLDSPATTSEVTYSMQIGGDAQNSSIILYVNRTEGDRDNLNMDARVASSITLLEVAG